MRDRDPDGGDRTRGLTRSREGEDVPVNEPLDLAHLQSKLEDAGTPWRMSHTSMSALTEEERVTRLGVPLPPDAEIRAAEANQGAAQQAARAATAQSVGAPVAFDLRNVAGVNYSTPIKDQGNCGSCVAFGTVASLEGVTRYTRRTPNLPIDLSEAHLFYCWGASAGARCNTGWWPDQALNAARDHGIAFEDYFPYTPGDQACAVNADWPNHMVKAGSWQYLTNDAASMKTFISTYGAIDACFYVYQDFFSYAGGVYQHVSGSLAGGHCVSLVGYDDGQGCWIGKNSWGTGWGESGYFRIAYGQCGIESWQVCGIPSTIIRSWLPNQQILGLWTNEYDSNVWAYGSVRGWMRLDGVAVPTGHGMVSELASAKAGGRAVGVFEDNGTVTQLYAW
jgi:C1A family cysteine protease